MVPDSKLTRTQSRTSKMPECGCCLPVSVLCGHPSKSHFSRFRFRGLTSLVPNDPKKGRGVNFRTAGPGGRHHRRADREPGLRRRSPALCDDQERHARPVRRGHRQRCQIPERRPPPRSRSGAGPVRGLGTFPPLGRGNPPLRRAERRT